MTRLHRSALMAFSMSEETLIGSDKPSGKTTSRAGWLSALGPVCVLIAAACQEPRVVIVQPPVEMAIHNLRASTITVLQRPCGASDKSFRPTNRISAGSTIAVTPIERCVDLVAAEGNDEIVGRQDDVHMMPGSTWQIR